MKQLILLVGAILLSLSSFADAPSSKNMYSLKILGSVWQTKQFTHPKHSNNDVAIVYGGADISHRPLAISIVAS
ncbi:MAG TPA: hypothetical protein VJN02_09645 [Gammaproteobacteria bacterium]|nr:hypothetical protein [Gammaproteobacteria bacterium]